MSDINNGGPAFPRPHSKDGDDVYWAETGMTLRDYFAAKALNALLTWPDADNLTEEAHAAAAYNLADAMLAAREGV